MYYTLLMSRNEVLADINRVNKFAFLKRFNTTVFGPTKCPRREESDHGFKVRKKKFIHRDITSRKFERFLELIRGYST